MKILFYQYPLKSQKLTLMIRCVCMFLTLKNSTNRFSEKEESASISSSVFMLIGLRILHNSLHFIKKELDELLKE